MDDKQRWSCENFALVPEAKRALCISHLRDSLTSWPHIVARWKGQAAQGTPLGSDDDNFHFAAGLAIRRILRQVVNDDDLPMVAQPGGRLAQDWVDFYIGALHAFITEEFATAEEPDRVEEVAHDLAGTCRMLEEFATAEERDSRAFCLSLDEKVFCCSVCDWWCWRDEESERVDGACDECEPEEDD